MAEPKKTYPFYCRIDLGSMDINRESLLSPDQKAIILRLILFLMAEDKIYATEEKQFFESLLTHLGIDWRPQWQDQSSSNGVLLAPEALKLLQHKQLAEILAQDQVDLEPVTKLFMDEQSRYTLYKLLVVAVINLDGYACRNLKMLSAIRANLELKFPLCYQINAFLWLDYRAHSGFFKQFVKSELELMLVMIARVFKLSNGTIDAKELAVFAQMIGDMKLAHQKNKGLMERLQLPLDELLGDVPPEKKMPLMEVIVNVCFVDGVLDDSERQFIKQCVKALGLEPAEIKTLRERLAVSVQIV